MRKSSSGQTTAHSSRPNSIQSPKVGGFSVGSLLMLDCCRNDGHCSAHREKVFREERMLKGFCEGEVEHCSIAVVWTERKKHCLSSREYNALIELELHPPVEIQLHHYNEFTSLDGHGFLLLQKTFPLDPEGR
uniref:Uncharacterized protein n=1 Tax=Cucumis melo TaxID=3656 RepID=A0A9I9EME3_CUCME